MANESDVLQTERQFFDSLVRGDAQALEQLLTDDFTIIDVMRGSEIAKPQLLEAIRSGQVKFEAVECRVRLHRPAAIISGRTTMTLRAAAHALTIASRYTHVYVEQGGRWRLAAAQGTQIIE
jgi:ketosteroid isomerase-like protein